MWIDGFAINELPISVKDGIDRKASCYTISSKEPKTSLNVAVITYQIFPIPQDKTNGLSSGSKRPMGSDSITLRVGNGKGGWVHGVQSICETFFTVMYT